jgi:hypothetical protein
MGVHGNPRRGAGGVPPAEVQRAQRRASSSLRRPRRFSSPASIAIAYCRACLSCTWRCPRTSWNGPGIPRM